MHEEIDWNTMRAFSVDLDVAFRHGPKSAFQNEAATPPNDQTQSKPVLEPPSSFQCGRVSAHQPLHQQQRYKMIQVSVQVTTANREKVVNTIQVQAMASNLKAMAQNVF